MGRGNFLQVGKPCRRAGCKCGGDHGNGKTTTEKDKSMKTANELERNKAYTGDFSRGFLTKGTGKAAGVLSPSYVFTTRHRSAKGPEAIEQVVTIFRNAFPDLKITIENDC